MIVKQWQKSQDSNSDLSEIRLAYTTQDESSHLEDPREI